MKYDVGLCAHPDFVLDSVGLCAHPDFVSDGVGLCAHPDFVSDSVGLCAHPDFVRIYVSQTVLASVPTQTSSEDSQPYIGPTQSSSFL